MKLSTKGRYGLKAMFELSLTQKNGPVPLKYIAKKQNISEFKLKNLTIIQNMQSLQLTLHVFILQIICVKKITHIDIQYAQK